MNPTVAKAREILSEYSEKRLALEKVYKQKLREISIPYAQEKARFKIGDIIESKGVIIRVEKIGAHVGKEEIYTTYKGPMLTKGLKVRKDNPKDGASIIDKDVIIRQVT